MRPIDAEALWTYIANNSACYHDCCPRASGKKGVLACIDEQPTIDAQPGRHGRWISLEGWFNKSVVKCSFCGNTLDMDGVNAGRGDANFCPNCGARMDGGAENAST